MFELLYKGGPVMIPIGILSLLALAFFFERLYVLRREKVLPARLRDRLRELLAEGKVADARLICEQDASPLAQVVEAGLNAPPSRRAERMEEAGRRMVAHLRRNVNVLGTTAAVEPLLGLLGTVTGMIGVFQSVTQFGVGNPATLAQGIWEALITTAAGLTIAIPAFIAYRYIVGVVEKLTLALESESAVLFDLMPPAPTADAAEIATREKSA